MPKIPLLDPTIRPKATPDVSPAPMMRPAAESFGGSVAQANERQGAALMNTGDVVWKRMFEHQERENAQQNLDVQTQFQKEIQETLTNPELDENNVPKGYLSRQLNQAKGSTVLFDQAAIRLKQKYMDMVSSPEQQQELDRALSTHLLSARESVISHESRQSQAAFDQSFQDNMKQTVGNASTVLPETIDSYLEAADKQAEQGWKHTGLDEVGIENSRQGYHAEIVKSALMSKLESDPKQAQALLNAVPKGAISDEHRAAFQNTVTDKMIDVEQKEAWNAVKGFKMSDGNINMALAQKYVESLKVPEDHKQKIFSFVHSMASVADSQLRQQQVAVEKKYIDDLVSNYKKDPADVAMAKAAMTGLPPAKIAELQQRAIELYKNPQLRFDTWKNAQPQETIAAIESSTLQVIAAYPSKKFGTVGGVKVNLQKAALSELETQWIGKTPAQIRQITEDALKNVVTKHRGWEYVHWDTKETSWKINAANRAAEDLRVGQLEKDNPEAFARARARVIRDGAPLVYDNIKAAMAKIGGGQ